MDHIDLLVKAIEDVDVKSFIQSNDSEVKILNERSFAYELYRVWYDFNKEKKNGLVINAEITKRIDDNFKKNAEELFGDKTERFLPDMVLHHSQWDNDYQELICEIKIFEKLTKDSLLRDLKKLVAYTTPECILYHHFKNAVFILINGTPEGLIDKFTMKEIAEYKNSPITCLFVNICGNIKVERCSLKKIVERDFERKDYAPICHNTNEAEKPC